MTIDFKQKWVQDLPPPGGYEPLPFGRQTPKMISGYKLFGFTALIMSIGTYVFINQRIQDLEDKETERRKLSKILPIIQAENDIMFLSSPHENVYHTRWMPPLISRNIPPRLIPSDWIDKPKKDTHHH